MKSIKRASAPACLCDGDDAAPAPRQEWYTDLYKKDGSIKDRWNSQELDEHGVSSIRNLLSTMSDHQCAWCERHLQRGWQVDHWLPDKKFPLVAYCWDNLLPSCPGCNRRKSAVIPMALDGKKVVDPLLRRDHSDAIVFTKSELFPVLPERFIDPSFDEPAQHLEFVVPALAWHGLTIHGKFTIRHLLSEKNDAQEWKKLSDMVHDLVAASLSEDVFDKFVGHILGLFGQPTLLRTMIAYWRDLIGTTAPSPS